MRDRGVHTLYWGLGSVVAVLLLGGCTPPERSITGITVENGQPVVLLRTCGDEAYAYITVSEHRSDSWLSLTPQKAHRATSFPLFQPPAGWSAKGATPPPLTDGTSYYVEVRTTEPAYSSVSFTSLDISGLKPGQVWAGGRTWAIEEFDRHVRDKC
ncbi:hypothetical protein [Kitasatospora sp. NPDC088351]|uniref:hypothetical protein n=1 Tax=Kitasatospora sp. NPDC088351 TaxID=3155180 RepID=UPI0034182D26